MCADRDSAARLDRALRRVRRIMIRPPIATIPIGPGGRPIELTKVVACLTIAEHATAGPTVADLAAAMYLDPSTASRLLSELAAEDLIARRSDPLDRRRTVVELKDAGRGVVERSRAVRESAIQRLLSDWDEADITTLASLLERFVATYDARAAAVTAETVSAFGGDQGCS